MSENFGDIKYIQRMFDEQQIDGTIHKKIKTAFKLAHDVRKFEIELFWKRGTYFWAFILGSFSAYFITLNKMIEDNHISLHSFIELSVFSKIVLLVLSCTSFIFCLSWVLINKGAKFWQKNWEAHVDVMEDTFSGKLYKTILNTENEGFDESPLNEAAYDYSATKVTTLGSVVLMIAAFSLCIFHVIILFSKLMTSFYKYKIFIDLKDFFQNNNDLIGIVIGFIIVGYFGFFAKKLLDCKGNVDNPINNENQKKWRQRKISKIINLAILSA